LGFHERDTARKVVADTLVQVAPELSRSVANMRLYARERQTAERLQELDDLREGFFALVAHEVRSPLGAIGTAASVLRDHGSAIGADEAREMAAGISASARRLARLTGDLVDVSRGGQGAFPCEMGSVTDLGAVVASATTAAAGKDGDRVHVCVEPGLSMRGDVDRLAQIVTNLVTNALKFSPSAVEVTLAPSGTDAELRVVDHGAGVPAAHAHRLFERYTRLPYDGPGVRPSGSGLGLYITRELALAHGGDLWHEPTPGGGATFVLRLPLT
jgi:signal transduction histidine kinase